MSYKLRSVFSSLQGEGRNSGKPATFIRFSDCNLMCPWCDTKRHAKMLLPLPDLMAKVEKMKNRNIIITGGEPTIEPKLGELLKALKAEGYWIALETNGLRNLPELELFDYISVSPKALYQVRYTGNHILTKANEVRIVAEDEKIVPFCRSMRKLIQADDYYISPLEDRGRIHYRRAYKLLMALNKDNAYGTDPWKLSIQMHKILGIK